jgi:plastocyanin
MVDATCNEIKVGDTIAWFSRGSVHTGKITQLENAVIWTDKTLHTINQRDAIKANVVDTYIIPGDTITFLRDDYYPTVAEVFEITMLSFKVVNPRPPMNMNNPSTGLDLRESVPFEQGCKIKDGKQSIIDFLKRKRDGNLD